VEKRLHQRASASISNRHSCRLETRINPSASITSLFLIVTKSGVIQAWICAGADGSLRPRRYRIASFAATSSAMPPRMSRGTCFAPAALTSPPLCGDSRFTSHSLALRIASRTNGPLTTRLPRGRRGRAKGHCISNRGGSELEIPLSPPESATNKFLIATFCHSLDPQSPLLRTGHRSLVTDHESRFPSLPLARALGIVF